jgi:hypothetical protein
VIQNSNAIIAAIPGFSLLRRKFVLDGSQAAIDLIGFGERSPFKIRMSAH